MLKKLLTLFLNLTVLAFFVFAENSFAEAPKIENQTKIEESVDIEKELPSGFRGIMLGMDLEMVKDILETDAIFGYKGDRDLSLLTTPNRSSIETVGSSFISRAWFQFYEEVLYTITLKLNTDKVDYYSIYSHFVEKYGNPFDINPKRAIWESKNIRITIERPLTVKYLSLDVFNLLLEQSQTEKTQSETNREKFIEAF